MLRSMHTHKTATTIRDKETMDLRENKGEVHRKEGGKGCVWGEQRNYILISKIN